MRLYFAGAENSEWRKFLAEEGIDHVSMSYVKLASRVKFARPWTVEDHFSPETHVLLDAGGYSFNKADSGVTEEEAMDMANSYMAFVSENIDHVEFVTEFDANILGRDWLEAMRADFYNDLPGDKFVPIWAAAQGRDVLATLASKYLRVGVLKAGLDASLVPLLNSVVGQYGVKLHGLGIADWEMVQAVKWDSVSSGSWIKPSQYGETIVWTGHELKRYPAKYKEQARKRHRSYIEKQGFDAQAIIDDDRKEVLRLSVWSWQQFMESLDRSRVLQPFGSSRVTPLDGNDLGENEEQGTDSVDPLTPGTRNERLLPAVPISRERKVAPVLGIQTISSKDDDGEDVEERLMVSSAKSLLQCNNCLIPATKILYADGTWREIGSAQPGDQLIGFDENHRGQGTRRRLQVSTVEAVRWSRQPTFVLETEHARVVTTAEHKWLSPPSYGKFDWYETSKLRTLNRLQFVGFEEQHDSDDYKRGYLSGMTEGDGAFRTTPSSSGQVWWRLALADAEGIRTSQRFIWDLTGETLAIYPHKSTGCSIGSSPDKTDYRLMLKLESRQPDFVLGLVSLFKDTGTDDYARGYLAGFFDAEGSFDGHNIRVHQMNRNTLEYVADLGNRIGQNWILENWQANTCSSARLVGSTVGKLSFFTGCRPRIIRKFLNILGHEIAHVADRVLSVEPTGLAEDVVDIRTSTHTFIAEGLATHNCEIRDMCPEFSPGSECAFDFPAYVSTKNQMRALQDWLITLQTQRVTRMSMMEQVKGGYADANLSAEADRLQRMINAKREAERQGFSLHIEASSSGEVGAISRIFGKDVGDASSVLPAPIRVDSVMENSGIVEGNEPVEAELVDEGE